MPFYYYTSGSLILFHFFFKWRTHRLLFLLWILLRQDFLWLLFNRPLQLFLSIWTIGLALAIPLCACSSSGPMKMLEDWIFEVPWRSCSNNSSWTELVVLERGLRKYSPVEWVALQMLSTWNENIAILGDQSGMLEDCYGVCWRIMISGRTFVRCPWKKYFVLSQHNKTLSVIPHFHPP